MAAEPLHEAPRVRLERVEQRRQRRGAGQVERGGERPTQLHRAVLEAQRELRAWPEGVDQLRDEPRVGVDADLTPLCLVGQQLTWQYPGERPARGQRALRRAGERRHGVEHALEVADTLAEGAEGDLLALTHGGVPQQVSAERHREQRRAEVVGDGLEQRLERLVRRAELLRGRGARGGLAHACSLSVRLQRHARCRLAAACCTASSRYASGAPPREHREHPDGRPRAKRAGRARLTRRGRAARRRGCARGCAAPPARRRARC